ncbi:class I SAM-dependent methyltransferase [Undibacterium sp. LX40W]|uniref:Class I SAM-dependent methyltransferase n=1 Tax=Undibacterium nitidum TaxID=2762298 RepID=A0A923KK19_9BURK|nr:MULTISPECIES: class I SAM-dependent methyltransferase [Undibacterium]MBC3880290.1 class I SAM-dependent methyltransferase [Undibacterium nitidum]MBC3890974.1 class I SAM-dependent methyltransferase [Undibacterium sp. LX40W]
MNAVEMSNATLIFPANHPEGCAYIESANQRGDKLVLASSIKDPEFVSQYGELHLLPYVVDTDFSEAFISLVASYRVTSIYAPVAAVFTWLEQFISQNNLSIRLLGASPIKSEVKRFDQLMGTVDQYRDFIDTCAGVVSPLKDLEIAAIFRMARHIYGETNEQKIAAMMGIFAGVPRGDVIEIGSLVGRSVAVMCFLARRFELGKVLAIDPWQLHASIQKDSPVTAGVDLPGEWDYRMLPQDFCVNTLPVGLGYLNYYQAESVDAFNVYCEQKQITSAEFGVTNYEGKISVIHIDGNHDFEKVKLDCELWVPLIKPGGCLILDDYFWVHGDGPKRVGDTLVERYVEKIEFVFSCGKALFVKFKTESQYEK